MLKEGVDHFEVTSVPPKVGVCGRKYVFNAGLDGLDPVAACPTDLEVQPEIRQLVAEKAHKDEIQVAALLGGGSSGKTPGWYPLEGGATVPGGSMPGTMLAEAETGGLTQPASLPVASGFAASGFAASGFAALPAERSLDDYVSDLVTRSAPLGALPRHRMDAQVAQLPAVGALDQFAPTNVMPARQVVEQRPGFGARLKGLFSR